MNSLMDFHFLRPWYLLMILPLATLCWWLWRERQQNTGLESAINPSLLLFLTKGNRQQPSPQPIYLLALVWLAATVALAGPVWERHPQAVFKPESVVIIALDLSPSMLAEDIKPSRVVRAHLKIQQLLEARKGGLTGLIVYGGEAFVVTPLTRDQRTIGNLLSTLTPDILPIPGSNVEMAIELAKELLENSGQTKASLLIVSDNIADEAVANILQIIPSNLQVSMLGVGTEAGAPIPYKGNFLKDSNGNIVIAKRNDATMKALAQQINGYYIPLQPDDSDINFFINRASNDTRSGQNAESDNGFSDEWYEFGPSLLLLILPLAALMFRRGWLLCFCSLAIFTGGLTPSSTQAANWDSLWLNSDQQGKQAWDRENYGEAARLFTDPAWQGSSLYRQGRYEEAIRAFQKDQSAVGDYNRGNALAQLQRFNDAIAAYDQALVKDPSLEQARINKNHLEELLKQQSSSSNTDKNQESNQGQSREDQASNASPNHQDSSKHSPSNSDSQNEEATDTSEQQDQKNQDRKSAQKQDDGDQPAQEEESKVIEQNTQKPDEALTAEQQQALQQWLRKVPDDPSGLLRRKFEYEYEKRQRLYQQGKWKPPENNAQKRY